MNNKKQVFLDVECYTNFFLIVLKDLSGKTVCFELDDTKTLDRLSIRRNLRDCETIGFNSRGYDIPMIEFALKGADNKSLKRLSDSIIDKDVKNFDLFSRHKIWTPQEYDHIDLMHVAGSYLNKDNLKVGLKMYGARINTRKLQDLPYDPSAILTEVEKAEVREYCVNDVDITIDLYKVIKPALDIRRNLCEQYGRKDLMSKSDAQIACKIFGKVKPKVVGYDFKYTKPSFINFRTEKLEQLYRELSEIHFKGEFGDKLLSDVSPTVTIGETTYKIGIGGIHSQETCLSEYSDDKSYISNIDVTSYYPSIIINNKIYPKHLGSSFFNDFKNTYNQRLEAKITGNVQLSATTKIILNGCFGKFADKYSGLYDPEILICVTLTGQLSMLMLIEMLELSNIRVISANTDGLVVRVTANMTSEYHKIISTWENLTKFKLEEKKYRSIHIQSVNHYVAINTDGTVTAKGVLSQGHLSKNPTLGVCNKAIVNFLLGFGTVEDYIINNKDKFKIEDLVMVRKVTSGGYYNGKYLGKVVRWYWSNTGQPIVNAKGNKVSNSDDAVPIMNLDEGVKDVNWNKYIEKTKELIQTIGVK